MITNLWQKVELYCGNRHEVPVRMDIQQGPTTVFYACPKYHEYNREPGEKACANFLYVNEYEKMLAHISAILIEADKNNEIPNLTGYKWSENGVDFEVFEHITEKSKEKIKIKMFNRRANKS